MSDFKTWWETEGSGMRPNSNEDIEEFAKRITQIAWSNGEYVEREACAQFLESTNLGSLPEDTAMHYARLLKGFAEAIRARSQS